jgi:hypothetical protein
VETLKFSVWQLLIEAMTLTSIAGLIALIGSMLLARSLTSLASLRRVRSTGPAPAVKNLRCVDELFTCSWSTGSYLDRETPAQHNRVR